MKKLFPLLLTACMLLSGCEAVETLAGIGVFAVLNSINRETPKDEIFAYVADNYETLESLPLDTLPEDYDEQKAFADSRLEGSPVQSIGRERNCEALVVDFSCEGAGNVTNSIYVGFYYSELDLPYPMVFDTETLTETAPGVYQWENEDSSHQIYTERIREHWYYYRVQWF